MSSQLAGARDIVVDQHKNVELAQCERMYFAPQKQQQQQLKANVRSIESRSLMQLVALDLLTYAAGAQLGKSLNGQVN